MCSQIFAQFKNEFLRKSSNYSPYRRISTHQALIQAADVPEFAAMDEQVSPAADEIVFVQVWASLLLKVGMHIDKFVLVQISAQLTQGFALEIDPATRANLVSMLALSGAISPFHDDPHHHTHHVSPASDLYV